MDLREAKALELAARAKIVWDGGAWLVPSQSTPTVYRVLTWPGAEKCECEDFQLRQKPCKHLIAARLVEEREGKREAPPIDTDILPIRKTYKQDWAKYNAAQAGEKRRFRVLLHDLCRWLPVRERVGEWKGRNPHQPSDGVFAMCYRVYCGLSSRRFTTDLLEAHKMGFLTKPFPGMKVPQFAEDPYYTPILKALVSYSARPLRTLERDFAIDSSGFGSTKYEKWYDHKYGITRDKCVWVKTHIASGVKTNVVTAVRILDKDAHDSPQFVPLVKETYKHFEIGEVSADKAYSSLENFEAVAECGGQAFIAFKTNATGGIGGLFEKAFHYFQFNQDEYLAHYHKRSNVESTFSAIKRKFGADVVSKNPVAMVNEALCKIIGHNITCLIQEQEYLGIVPVFWKDEQEAKEAMTPPETIAIGV